MIRTTMRVRRYAATAAAFTYINLALVPPPMPPARPCRGKHRSRKSSIHRPVARCRRHHHYRHWPMLAFGDTSGGFRKLIRSSSASASRLWRRAFLSFFSFGGGALV